MTVQRSPFPRLICIHLHKATISQVDGRHLIRINSWSVHSKNILNSKEYARTGLFYFLPKWIFFSLNAAFSFHLQHFSTAEDVKAGALFSANWGTQQRRDTLSSSLEMRRQPVPSGRLASRLRRRLASPRGLWRRLEDDALRPFRAGAPASCH